MRVLFINIALDGHHLDYLKALTKIPGIEAHVIIEKEILDIECKQHVLSGVKFGSNQIVEHLKWARDVKRIAEHVNPDIIHLVWGDSFYRFFGVGFYWLMHYKSVITFHQTRKSVLHKISVKLYSKIFSTVVVHTEFLHDELKSYGINRVQKITYPNFIGVLQIPQKKATEMLGIKTSSPILLSLGGTRIDKGLDILLQALNDVSEPFHLLIAGAEQNIKRTDIINAIRNYSDKVTVMLKYLSDDEMNTCYSACDYVVLPYRRIFDGASGPLAEGVAFGKCIIGPSHGSIGEIIKQNHVGLCFETENIESLASTIEKVLENGFSYDQKAKQYQEDLKITNFQVSHKKLFERLVMGESS